MRGIDLAGGGVIIFDDEDAAIVGTVRWSMTGNGYAHGYVRGSHPGRFVLLHRLLMNAKTGEQVDHINHNRLDNRRCNLRLCTNAQNGANSRKHKNGMSSRFKGITWDKAARSWRVHVRGRHVGLFKSEIEAARAYDNAACSAFGEFAHPNFAG